MTIGQRIREARKLAGLSQIELGKKVNRSQSAVAEWETEDSAPRRDVMDKLAEVLGVDRTWLEFGNSEAQRVQREFINVENLTEDQLFRAAEPVLSFLGLEPENIPAAVRGILRAVQAAQSLDSEDDEDRVYEIAGQFAVQEVRREIPTPKRK